MAFVLKTVFNQDIRRVLVDPVDGFKYADLRALLAKQFTGVKKEQAITYLDDEGDEITITSDEELSEAFRVAISSGLKSLKLQVGQVGAVVQTPPVATNEPKTTEPVPVAEPKPVHWGFTCDASGTSPIVGPRYHKRGANYDLCEEEFMKLDAASQAVFDKIDAPCQGMWFRRFQRQHQGRRGWRQGPPPHHHHRRGGWGGWGPGGWGGPRCGGRRWGGGRGGPKPNFVIQKAKWVLRTLRDSDITPLLSVLHEAGDAAAEMCAPLKELAAALKDEANMQTLMRIKQAPPVKKLKWKLKALQQQVHSGALSFFEAPTTLLNSDEWALAVAHLRNEAPKVASAVEQVAVIFPRFQVQLPALFPRLMCAVMQMSFCPRIPPATAPAAAAGPTKKPQYKAKFVKDETLPDGVVIAPGGVYTKTWTVANSGGTPWPKDTALLHVGGDRELRAMAPRVAVGKVGVGAEKQVSVELAAPETSGRYWSYWRLVSGDATAAQRFGLRLWADVTVGAPAAAEAAATEAEPVTTAEASPDAVPVSLPAPVAMAGMGDKDERFAAIWSMKPKKEEAAVAPTPAGSTEGVTPAAAPPVGAAEPAAAEVILEDALPPVPEELPVASAPAAPSVDLAPWKDAVEMLSAMGFDQEQFQSLLKRHKGNVQAVVQQLLQ